MARLFYVLKTIQISLALYAVSILLFSNKLCHEKIYNLKVLKDLPKRTFLKMYIDESLSNNLTNMTVDNDYDNAVNLLMNSTLDNDNFTDFEDVYLNLTGNTDEHVYDNFFIDGRSTFYISRCVHFHLFEGIKSKNIDNSENNLNEHSVYSSKMFIRWVVAIGTVIFIVLELMIVCTVFVTFSKPTKCQNITQCLLKLCPLVTVLGYLLIEDAKWAKSNEWLQVGGVPTFPISWVVAEIILCCLILSVILEIVFRSSLYAILKFQKNTFKYDFDEASQIFDRKFKSEFSLVQQEENEDEYPDPELVNKYAMSQRSLRCFNSGMPPTAPPRKFKSVLNTTTFTSSSVSGSEMNGSFRERVERSYSFGVNTRSD